MSMGMVTMIQFLWTMAAYLFVTLAVPHIVAGELFSHYRFAKRIIFYFITGNFYATNLIFLLQLLHISNFFTIWAGLIVVPLIVKGIIRKYPFKEKLKSGWESFRKILSGSLGIKSVIVRAWDRLCVFIRRAAKSAVNNFSRNWFDWILIGALTLMVMWVYGIRMLSSYGYAASDIPVHLYWVNGMSDNNIFVAGIYPFGMHCIIYLLNTAFRIDTYVIFRVFAMIQCLAIHIIALLFLKLCCKSRFAAYTGVFLYAIGNYISLNNLNRYLSTLPQEFSMIFILPTAYFAFSFFKQLRRELKDDLPKKDSTFSLCGLAMSFALSFTAHFYGAMIAAVFCIAIAIGHIGWLVRPAYLKRLVITGLLSVLVAVLPMVIAYIGGTPLQGSLYWGSNVIKQSQAQITTGTTTEGDETVDPGQNPDSDSDLDSDTPGGAANNVNKPGLFKRIGRKIGGAVGKITDKFKQIFSKSTWDRVGSRMNTYTLQNSEEWYSLAVRWAIVALIAAGIILLPFPKARSYGAMMISTGVFMVLMSILFVGNMIGLPMIMNADRVSMFYSYLLIILIGLIVDICVYSLTFYIKHRLPMDILSLAVVVALGFGVWHQGRIRSSLRTAGLETNEAITCLTSIIASEEDYKWTIFSANDETNMVYGHGYHYELSTFLHEIEKIGGKPVTVPTETVYFYIEKIPIDYTVSYDGSGQMVSRKGAEQPVPNYKGLTNYQGRNRWIIMSHMYYWAQEFQRRYPKEMTVYFENDQFICYRLEQNTYRLYDLAIDYGYNS